MNEPSQKKYKQIQHKLRDQKVLVAFSGGVDSTVLAAVVKESASQVILLTVHSPTVPQNERDAAVAIAKELDLPHLTVEYDWLADKELQVNPKDRCYKCKKKLASKF